MKDRGFMWLAGMACSCAVLIWANGQHPSPPKEPQSKPPVPPAASEPLPPTRSTPKPHPLGKKSSSLFAASTAVASVLARPYSS